MINDKNLHVRNMIYIRIPFYSPSVVDKWDWSGHKQRRWYKWKKSKYAEING